MNAGPSWLAGSQARGEMIAFAVRAHQLLGERLGRDLYSVPALDMLLDLYLLGNRKPRSLSSLCGAAHVPIRSALRTINRMTDKGLLIRAPDPDDARRVNVELTGKAVALLGGYFDALEAIRGGEREGR
ncbi:MAG: winged helix-turn-helix transcriptional regulator [Sphingobium sp.]|nr:winged helix-turn-helix transcriptional regulator [Sphingobium sp.]